MSSLFISRWWNISECPGMKTGDGPQFAGRIPNTLKSTVFAGTRKYIFLRRTTATTTIQYSNGS